jgi:hypothetical protein
MYTQKELAAILNVSPDTVRFHSGKLSLGKRVGHNIIYTEIEADKLRKITELSKPPKIISVEGEIAYIEIKGYTVIVDSEDLVKIRKYVWRRHGRGEYFITTTKTKRRKNIFLHRYIMDAPKGTEIDHKNSNTLDNRKSNLRFCTSSENKYNRGRSKANTSGYKGVTKSKKQKRWQSKIKKDKKMYYLGRFDTPEAAYAAYCEAAKKLHGEFARFA